MGLTIAVAVVATSSLIATAEHGPAAGGLGRQSFAGLPAMTVGFMALRMLKRDDDGELERWGV